MEETPNDSGASLNSAPLPAEPVDLPIPDEVSPASRWGETGIRRMSSEELRQEVRRPAVWGLLLLVAVVILFQVWLLFL
jgi:hypothetical protein